MSPPGGYPSLRSWFEAPGLRPASYGIRGGSASLRVRRALLFYALRRLGLDVAADVRPASEQHIVLVNRAEVAAAQVRPGQT